MTHSDFSCGGAVSTPRTPNPTAWAILPEIFRSKLHSVLCPPSSRPPSRGRPPLDPLLVFAVLYRREVLGGSWTHHATACGVSHPAFFRGLEALVTSPAFWDNVLDVFRGRADHAATVAGWIRGWANEPRHPAFLQDAARAYLASPAAWWCRPLETGAAAPTIPA